MYMGKGALMAKKQAKEKKSEMARAEMEKNAQKVKHVTCMIDQRFVCQIPIKFEQIRQIA